MAVKVYKFGGALLNKIEGFEQLKKIICVGASLVDAQNTEQQQGIVPTKPQLNDRSGVLHMPCNKSEEHMQYATTIIVVVSALEKTTSKLANAAKTAELQDEEQAMIFINEIFDYHFTVAKKIISDEKNQQQIISILEENKSKITKIIRGISITKELTPRTRDLVLSFGEILASNITTVFLNENFSKNDLNITLFDIKNVLKTDSNYGAAIPNISETKEKIQELFLPVISENQIVVTQGFIASNQANETTTMGYESSNLTATILAGLTNANEFIIWSDTEGIRQFDPKISTVKTPKLVEKIDYDFAEFLANCGLKLIHPPMIKYLKIFDLEVVYKSGFAPEGDFTVIGKNCNSSKKRFLIHSENLTLYYKNARTEHLELENLSSLTFIFSEESEVLQLCSECYKSNIKIYEIFINSIKKTAVILFKSDSKNNFLENCLQSF